MLRISAVSVLFDSLDDVDISSATSSQVSEVHYEPEDWQILVGTLGQTSSSGVLSSFLSSIALSSRMTVA